MYAGEPFPVSKLRQLKKILPRNCQIANIYGPTETNIITCYRINDIPADTDDIPIGTEVEDTEILVVNNESNKICAPYEVGELWCRGGTVGLGYFGRQSDTDRARVASPFHNYSCTFWKTGDYGFRDHNGVLHYRGRLDNIVKINGYRIELGEIETILGKYNELDEFSVVVNSQKKLVCYFVANKHTPFSLEQLKRKIATELPDYMIPSTFVEKDELPKTSSGKIDRVLLAVLDDAQ